MPFNGSVAKKRNLDSDVCRNSNEACLFIMMRKLRMFALLIFVCSNNIRPFLLNISCFCRDKTALV